MESNKTNLLPGDRQAIAGLNLASTAFTAAFQSIQSDGLSIDQSLPQNDQPIQAHPNSSMVILHSAGNLSYFEAFTTYYSEVHGYISLTVCIFGIIANLVNILVLTRWVLFLFSSSSTFKHLTLETSSIDLELFLIEKIVFISQFN